MWLLSTPTETCWSVSISTLTASLSRTGNESRRSRSRTGRGSPSCSASSPDRSIQVRAEEATMFRILARLFADPALSNAGSAQSPGDPVFATHPIQLSRWLEQVFAGGGIAAWPSVGSQTVTVDPDAIRRLQLPEAL